jgi:peptide/nickel transport system substrate-binding protein
MQRNHGSRFPFGMVPGLHSRRDLIKYSAALGLATPAGAALLSPGSVAAEGGTISLAISATPTSMDISKPDWVGWWGVNYLYDTLLTIDENEALAPLLAETWEVSTDGLTYTVHLQQGVTFHDGTPFNADAVKFNYDRVLNDPDNGWNSVFTPDIAAVDVVDDSTVKFTLKIPDVFFGFTCLADWGAIQISPTAWNADPANYDKNPVGTGPFTFKSFQADAQIEYAANPNYWGGAPTIDGILIRIIPESSTRNIELEAGTLDIGCDMQVQDTVELADANLHFDKVFLPSAHFVTMNVSTGLTAELAVRKAIARCIDRDTILKEVLYDVDEKSWSGVAKASPYYSEDVPTIAYNPDEAKQLLDAAGWVAGGDGMRSRDGKPLKVILLSADYTNWNQFNQIIQQQMKTVGIDSDLQTLEWGAYLDKWRDTDDWEVSFHNQLGGFQANNIAYATVDPRGYWSINHLIRSKDPDLMAVSDKLIELYDKFNLEPTLDGRRALSIEFQTIFQENQLTAWLWHQPNLFAIANKVTDYSMRYNTVQLTKASV